MSIQERDELFLANLTLARGIAGNMIKFYGLDWSELDDLTQAGLAYALEHVPKYWLRDLGQSFDQIFRFSVRAGIGKYVRDRWTVKRGARVRHVSLDSAPEGCKPLSRILPGREQRPDEQAELKEEWALAMPIIARRQAVSAARNAAYARKQAARRFVGPVAA